MPDMKVIAFGKVLPLIDKPFYENESVYVPVRDICEELGIAIWWDGAKRKVWAAKNGKMSFPECKVFNGKAVADISFLQEIIDCDIEVLKNYNIIAINYKDQRLGAEDMKDILPDYKNYTREDLEWLSKIVHAEARGENYANKLAVANVIINRTADRNYPSTIRDVIFDKRSGVQFTPTIDGAVYNTPSFDSFLAALEALEGKNNSEDALFFINPQIAQSSWVSRNREFAFAIGNHSFYN